MLKKASSKRHAVPGCETIRISKPSCVPGKGDLAGAGDAVPGAGAAWVCCVGPQGRTVLLHSAVDRHAFRTPHRGQTVDHGPVVYAKDPYRRLESASSVLELALLRIFLKPAAHLGQREYRFAVWTDGDPAATGWT